MKLEGLKICNVCQSNNIVCIDKSHNIYKCRNCGYIFDNPRPAPEEIAKFYSQFDKYDSWLAQEQARDLLYLRRLKKLKKYKKTGALLDVGTGIGHFLYFAKNDFDVIGTEVSESAIRLAKQKYDIDLLHGEIENIDFKGAKFDVITILHVLEHVPNPSSTIRRCKELLKNDGIIIVAVPNDIYSFKAMTRRLLSILKIGRFKNRGKFGLPKITLNGSRDEIHLSHFAVPALKTLFTKNDFIIIEIGLDPYYPSRRYKRIIDDLYYLFCSCIWKIFRVNVYNALWLVARVNQ